MADSSLRDAEAVVDEVTLLEAALREAMQKRQHFGGLAAELSPGGIEMQREIFKGQLGYGLDASAASLPARQNIDMATAAYGAQLKAWIDMAVDSRLNVVVPSLIEGEVLSLQQEGAAAARLYQRMETEVELVKGAQSKLLSVVEGLSEEFGRVKLQGEALTAVEKMMFTVEELKQSVAVGGQRSLDPMHLERLSTHDADLTQMRSLHDDLRGRHDRHEARFAELDDIISDLRRSHSEAHGGLNEELVELRRLCDGVHSSHGEIQGALGNLRGLYDELRTEHSGRHDTYAGQFSELQRALEEIQGLHNGFSDKHQTTLADLHRLHSEARDRHERALEEATGAMAATKQEVADLVTLVRQLEKRSSVWRSEIISEVAEEIRALDTSQQNAALKNRELQSWSGDLEARVESLYVQVVNAAKQEELQELRGAFEEAQRTLSSELLKHQQRLVSELRAETSTAFRSEAAAVAALDEQLWLTDQRLGQRIDELAHSHRECITVVERRIGNVLQNRLHTPTSRDFGDQQVKERLEVEVDSDELRHQSRSSIKSVGSVREDLQRELGKTRSAQRHSDPGISVSRTKPKLEEVNVRIASNGVVTEEVVTVAEEDRKSVV